MSKKGEIVEGNVRGRKVHGFDNPDLVTGSLEQPRSLKTIKDVRLEMARVYRGIYAGKLTIQQAGSLIFMLDKLVKAIKDQVSIDALSQNYMQAWGGFSIVAPSEADAEKAKRPAQEVLPPPKGDEDDDKNSSDD
jgi:hypothetical protein